MDHCFRLLDHLFRKTVKNDPVETGNSDPLITGIGDPVGLELLIHYDWNMQLLSVIFLTASFNVFASGEKWVSVGYPVFVHMGTDGTFILNGSEHGTCDNVKPSSFRVNMKEPHAKEMFSWILYMAAQKKELSCVVNSGCGTKKVTINFCRGRVD